MEERVHSLMALTLVPGIGNARIRRILRETDDPSEVFRWPRSRLKFVGLSREMQYYVLGGWARKDADRALESAGKKGVSLLSFLDSGFPACLREIYEPPLLLYTKGDSGCLGNPSVAIVGSRRCSVYGGEVAVSLARDLGRHGLQIVSGMARGIDSHAHWGALSVGASTVAVLGTGVDVVYPRGSRKLYERIAQSGCLVSEFPLGTYPAAQNFPIRNRIISGLSLGTVIPEAAEFSGSLITARLTLEQNRELWAIPGNITNAGSYGPNYLIKQGAKPVLSFQDILEELPPAVLRSLSRRLEGAGLGALNDREGKLLSVLSADKAVHFDRLLAETGFNVTDLSALLVNLEGRGLIRAFPGRRYSRRMASLPPNLGALPA